MKHEFADVIESQMIRIACPQCGSKLNAKPELAGQTRKCPKCGGPIAIPLPESPSARDFENLKEQLGAPTEQAAAALERAGSGHGPLRLNRQNRYFVCSRLRLLATWESNGQGWMLKTIAGFVPVVRNRDRLPVEGDFRLIELKLEATESGHRLSGLTVYQLSHRWSLNALARGDDAICRSIAGPAGLNRDQKNAVLQTLRSQMMRPIWENAQKVLDYLSNMDYHTSVVGG